MTDVEGPLTLVVRMIVAARQGAALRRLEEKARTEQQRAKREALKEARASEKQQQEWLKKITREKTFGDAGNATEEEAMEMARGRVGRRNPLDDRKF